MLAASRPGAAPPARAPFDPLELGSALVVVIIVVVVVVRVGLRRGGGRRPRRRRVVGVLGVDDQRRPLVVVVVVLGQRDSGGAGWRAPCRSPSGASPRPRELRAHVDARDVAAVLAVCRRPGAHLPRQVGRRHHPAIQPPRASPPIAALNVGRCAVVMVRARSQESAQGGRRRVRSKVVERKRRGSRMRSNARPNSPPKYVEVCRAPRPAPLGRDFASMQVRGHAPGVHRPEGEEEVGRPQPGSPGSRRGTVLVQATGAGADAAAHPVRSPERRRRAPRRRRASRPGGAGGPRPPDPVARVALGGGSGGAVRQLTQVHHTNSSDSLMGDDRAVNCLLALAADPSPKRPRWRRGDSRRRLKMRSAEPSRRRRRAAERADGGAFDRLPPPSQRRADRQLKPRRGVQAVPAPSEAQLAPSPRVGLAPEMAAQWFASRRVLGEGCKAASATAPRPIHAPRRRAARRRRRRQQRPEIFHPPPRW